MTNNNMLACIVLIYVNFASPTTLHAWDRLSDNSHLRINLKTGRVFGFSEYIFFESIVQPNAFWNRSSIYVPKAAKNSQQTRRPFEEPRGCSMQAVLKIKMSSSFNAIHFQLMYHRPKLWTLHMAQHNKAKGFGSANTLEPKHWRSKDIQTDRERMTTEMQIHNRQLRLYSGADANKDLTLIKIVDDVLPRKGRSKISMDVENHGLRWIMDDKRQFQKGFQGRQKMDNWGNNMRKQESPARRLSNNLKMGKNNNNQNTPTWSFQSDLIFDFYSDAANSTFLYVGLNRAVGTAAKYGSGLCAISVTLQKPREKRDECRAANHTCDQNAFCKRNRNSARCVCKPGFHGNGIRCLDENECNKNNGHCAQQCINTNGSHFCSCHKGFTLAFNKYDCEDIDECKINNGNCLHECVNMLGSYKCVCHKGYVLGADGFSCFQESRDEICKRLNCSHGCRMFNWNLAKCFCKAGFKLHPNGQDCVPTCLIHNGGCQHKCINTLRGSICSCQNGYILGKDKKACFATCSIENGGCERTCRDSEEGAKCSCPVGYQLKDDNKTCSDIDECSMKNGNCHQLCINYPGTYECSCQAGYYLSPSNFRQCLDIDECRMNNVCDHFCINKLGSYECRCRPGFHLHGSRYCGDNNECSQNNGGCEFQCVNTIGSFVCMCPLDHIMHPNGKDCLKTLLSNTTQIVAAENALNCLNINGKEKCSLKCKGVESFSSQPGYGYSMDCFIAKHNSICEGSPVDFDSKQKMTIGITTLTDKCDLMSQNSSLSKLFASTPNLKSVVGLCSFNIICRRKDLDGLHLLEIKMEIHSSSFLLHHPEASTKFSPNFMAYFVNNLIQQMLKSDSLFVEFRGLTYNLRVSNNFSNVMTKKYACSTNLYYNFTLKGCLQCPKGYYRIDNERFLECTPCPSSIWSLSDYYVRTSNINACTASCGKGSYSFDGSHPCELCPIGTYQSEIGRISCKSCGSGIDTTVSGSQTFQDCYVKEYCRIGNYFDEKLSKCTPCTKGTYQPEKGLNYCITCPSNSTTDGPGSSSIEQCKSTICTHFTSKLGGYIESSNYPANYPSNVLCTWDLRATGRNKILVFIPDMSLSADDCRDYVVMRKSESPYSPTSFETCESNKKPTAFVARTRRLVIEFGSDHKNNAKGFRIFYAFYHEQYQSLIEDIVKDDRIYDLPNHEALLRNGHFLSALMDIMSEPSNYQKYINVTTALFPRSFIDILWPKLHRFFDVADL